MCIRDRWASTRDVRGGKGERDLAHWLIVGLAREFPETAQALLPLIPEYGSWRDVTALVELKGTPPELVNAMITMMATQLRADGDAVKPSLCAKWAPRPKSAHKEVAKSLAKLLFPEHEHPLPEYRKMLAALNVKLGTVEVLMCGHDWSSIKPGAVPARCLKIHRAAFMNETVATRGAKEMRSEDEDRKTCATQFVEHAVAAMANPTKAKMHGRVLHPHEMVEQYLKGGRNNQEDVILEAQWVDLRERLRTEFPELGKMVPLVDVSGSMSGTPLHVAVALGILISELSVLRDRFITFSSTPTWHAMQPEWSLHEKVKSAKSATWEMSTDFQKALEMLLEGCVAGDVAPEEIGELSLVVLSDMQFDSARGNNGYGRYEQQSPWETQYEALVKLFKQAGRRSKYKVPFPVPRVIFWNLRGDTKDFAAAADTPGVSMVSGFSPDLLKLFMNGSLEEMMPTMHLSNETAAAPKPGVDPYATLRKALDDPRYSVVRETCARVGEGAMAGYEAPVVEAAGAEGEEDGDFVMVDAE
eukprot:TRINITY_DN4168_c0_g1_i2.p1 TRINITY_DN4168_c0_g1~~TRINITY_DN4168_c0_g1_i2.p1  ORF type:complete len:529 (-),score=143.70 TRINITY_DN4168_c0_g1_i2:136-1722(-)